MNQPLSDFIGEVFKDESVLKLDLKYDWPNQLNLQLNNIRPDCLVVDKKSGTLVGLDKNSRILPLDMQFVDWERPVLTGVKVNDLYKQCNDIRVQKALRELLRLRNEKLNFYRLIEQIDFSHNEYLEIRLAGLDYDVWVRVNYFYDDIIRYIDFVARYKPDLQVVKIVDLRFDNMVITREKRT